MEEIKDIQQSETVNEFEEVENLDVENKQDNISDNNNSNEKLFTQEEINKIIADRVKREKHNYDKKLKSQLQESGFSDELLNREQTLSQREKEVTQREQKFNVALRLQAEGLPIEMANLVNYDNEKTIEKSYQELSTLFTNKLQNEVEKTVSNRLKGTTPKVSGGTVKNLDTQIDSIFKKY